MKKIAVLIIVILLILLTFAFKNSFSAKSGPPDESLPSQESSEGPVSVKVVPTALSSYEITLDTHSGELDGDLVVLSELTDDKGNTYKPVSWEGDPPGGHHRSGVLKFKSLSPKPKSIELKIKDVGGIPERSFKWTF